MKPFQAVLALLLGALPSALTQDIPFDINGGFQGCSTDGTAYNAGGFIKVNGWTIKVPQNTQVGFPAAWIPWKDFCNNAGFYNGMEVTVVGNSIPTHGYTAGQIYISQFFVERNQGYVSAVNFDGTMQIANGPKIRINDPNAVYSSGYTGRPFFTADDQNPSIAAFSGFPMCVPRSSSDPLCPQTNRPNTAGGGKQGTFTAPDPLTMAPFQVGDFIEFAGFTDPGSGEVICYAITALNVQITTTGTPAFIRMEDVLIGVYTNNPNAEIGATKFIGYVSQEAAGPVTVYAIEYDPCTGEAKDRQVSSASVIAGAARLKFRQTIRSVAGDKYAREYRIATSSGTKMTNNGILAGQYVNPVTEWIQPELTTPGIPPIPNDFSAFTHLTQGLGRDSQGQLWGPLNPFPQSGVAVFDNSQCPPAPQNPTTPSPSSSATPTPTPSPVPVDTVEVVAAQWISSGSGTLTVTCTSSNTNNNLVGMLLDTPNQSGLVMTGSTTQPGTWTFSSVKIKQVTTVTCRSKLGGKATGPVAGKRRRRGSIRDDDTIIRDVV
ncbi:hypothetical protein QBC46DRAFT_452429 [Diplogelasinospora grovesii]|uniref:Uncharacterized protein n=1 Tax=Diplogelasinospora grovesii TaxID=303347 RepID=A0AAN6N1T8_9PEZI|nr:hypothetical protein QBC46DRAFT_452429 [Diplogelasinospora grovesii]